MQHKTINQQTGFFAKSSLSLAKKFKAAVTLQRLFLLLLTTTLATPSFAEEPVIRTGVFDQQVYAGECDGIEETLEDVGDFVLDGLEYLGEKTLNSLVATFELVTGNPDAFINEINSTFADLTTVASFASQFTPLALIAQLDLIPDGAVGDFFNKGLDYAVNFQEGVITGIVSGLNPVTRINEAENDFLEIGGDFAAFFSNLDDPEAAG